MARKQVLVQLDDELVASLDRWAEGEKVSRSELIRRAVTAQLRDLDWAKQDRITAEAYTRTPEAQEGPEPWTEA